MGFVRIPVVLRSECVFNFSWKVNRRERIAKRGILLKSKACLEIKGTFGIFQRGLYFSACMGTSFLKGSHTHAFGSEI